jgi:hypothetical protein
MGSVADEAPTPSKAQQIKAAAVESSYLIVT